MKTNNYLAAFALSAILALSQSHAQEDNQQFMRCAKECNACEVQCNQCFRYCLEQAAGGKANMPRRENSAPTVLKYARRARCCARGNAHIQHRSSRVARSTVKPAKRNAGKWKATKPWKLAPTPAVPAPRNAAKWPL